MKRSGFLIGALCGILAALCYGMNPLGAVWLYREGYGTSTVLMYRLGLATLILGAVMVVRRISFRITFHDLREVILLGLLFAVSSLTFYASFLRMDVGIACTILFVYPLMTELIMMACFHERTTWVSLVATALAFAGIAYLSCDGGEHRVDTIGVVEVLVSALTYAIYIIVVNRTHMRFSVVPMTFWVTLWCVAGIAAWALLSDGPSAFVLPKTASAWGSAVFLAVFPTLLALLFIGVSAKRLGSTPTAILGALEPLTAVAIGVFVFGEAFSMRLAIGIVGILSGVLLVLTETSRQSPERSLS